MLLLGIAFALVYGPLTIMGTAAVGEAEQGPAGGLLYTSFQFGAAIGLSAAAAALGGAPGPGPLDAFRAALVVPLLAALLAACVVGAPRARPRPSP